MPPHSATSAPEQIYYGIGITHAIALGRVYALDAGEAAIAPRIALSDDEVAGEETRFDAAVAAALEEVDALLAHSRAAEGDANGEIVLLLEAHRAMLAGSRLVRGARTRIGTEKIAAESAVEAEVAALGVQFRAISDRYIAARIDDIRAVGRRLVRRLLESPALPITEVPEGGIVLARDLSPAETALLDPTRVGGLVTVHGGAAGHTAVVARGLGLPAVLGVPEAILDGVVNGARLIVDGIAGRVIVQPTDETWRDYEDRHRQLEDERAVLASLIAAPAVTADGVDIALRANLEQPRDAASIAASGARGIGLFRTEFLFMNRADLPSEDEQYQAIAGVVATMRGEPVTFRTLDIGGDKMAASLDRHLGDAANPALGLRAIRLSLKYPDLLKTQFRAILRAGAHGPVRILLPMVATVGEVEEARAILSAAWDELTREGAPLPASPPPVGVMIEVPAAALSADSLAAVADFFALGTNDLVQYTVAIDRGNDQVADLYNPLHPAVLRLIQFTVLAGQRAGLEVSICGEMGADPRLTPLLLGLGIREISVGAASVPRIKRRIREISLDRARAHAEDVLGQNDPAEIYARIRDAQA